MNITLKDELQDKRRATRRTKRKSDRSRASSTINTEGKPRYDHGRSDSAIGHDSVSFFLLSCVTKF